MKKGQEITMASMKSRFRPSHDAKLHMLAEPFCFNKTVNENIKTTFRNMYFGAMLVQ